MSRSTVETVVAVHDPRRPLARCVRSLVDQRRSLADSGADLTVRVVVHNTDLDAVRAALPPTLAEQVTWSHLHDGVLSAAGPFNQGLDEATGTFVSTVGSDDVLEPGALAAWFTRAQETGADAVVAALRTDAGVVSTPYLRPGRPAVLHPVRDGLAYRTAPLGLLRLQTLRDIGFRYTSGGHSNGEDIEPALRLWFSGARIAYPYGAPCYRVLDDMGADRVTAVVGPLRRELGFLPALLEQPWLASARPAEREAVAVKLARMQVVEGVRRRVDAARSGTGTWDADDAACVAQAAVGLRALAGDGLAALSRFETSVLTQGAGVTGNDELVAWWDGLQVLPPTARVLPVGSRGWASWSTRPAQLVRGQAAARSGSFAHPQPPAGWLETLTAG